MDFEEYCKDNGIVTLYIPPHLSYKLQSLDIIPFNILKRVYSVYIEGLMRRHQTHIAKEDFLVGFFEASKQAMTQSNIRSGFAAAGLVPMDPERVISVLDIAENLRTPSSNLNLPPQVWISQIPIITIEISSQAILIRNSIQRH